MRYKIKVVTNDTCEKKVGWYSCEVGGELQVCSHKEDARSIHKDHVDELATFLETTYKQYKFKTKKMKTY